jgi:transketolase
MTNSEIAARLTEALETAASREAGAPTALVSVEIAMAARAAPGEIATTLARKTRTLVFMSADLTSEAGARIATAASVHKVLAV